MKTYKITYWNNGNILSKSVESESERQAQFEFYMTTACDDIISIKEVTEDV